MKAIAGILLLASLLGSGFCLAREERIPLWQGKMPVQAREDGEEHFEEGRIYNVRVPEMVVYRPVGKSARGTGKPAVLIFPGGSYGRLAVIKEGEKTARKLNSAGVTVFVVKYRLKEFGHPAPLLDGLRAIHVVRERADEWGIDKNKIGVLGFSAGGHLAAMIATQWNNREFLAPYGFAGEEHKPDFAGLVYPVVTMTPPLAHRDSQRSLLGESPSARDIEFNSPERHVNAGTPVTFLVHGNDDAYVPVENSLLFYQALNAIGIPVEIHILQNAPHGFGLGNDYASAKNWSDYFIDWMRANGFLKNNAFPQSD